MLSLIVLIAAALVTSFSAVSLVPWPPTGAVRKKSVRESSLLHIGAGVLALGSVLLAVHIQQGAFQLPARRLRGQSWCSMTRSPIP